MSDESWIVPPPATSLNGTDRFVGMNATVVEFWKFAMSDLRMNNTRGYLAEFLVAKALGLNDVRRVEWDSYDLLLGQVRIEVKSSAYLQAWDQPRLSRIGFSGLRGTRYHARHGYDPAGKGLNAHVYVFCVQTATTHETYNPIDLGQWLFYVVKRSDLDRLGSGSVGLATVVRLARNVTAWSDLKDDVVRAAEGEDVDDSHWWI